MATGDLELTEALLEGAFEEPLWGAFLSLIRARTGADHATLIFRPPGGPLRDAVHLYSGPLNIDGVRRTYTQYMSTLDLLSEQGLREGRVYAYQELYPPKNPNYGEFYRQVIIPSGVTASRVIRVAENSGVSAWLTISRAGTDFGDEAADVLRSIATTLRGALRYYVALERERYAAGVIGHAMRALYFGWMTLDRDGGIIDFDPEVDVAFKRSGVISRGSSGRLQASPEKLEKDIYSMIHRLADNPRSRPYAITLKQDPWLDMLLVRAPHAKLAADRQAAVVAYVHGDSWRSSDRFTQLNDLFGLTPSEAKLTLTLSRGISPAEAAVELGISLQTVRSYTKVIYSKTGARGIADLVRIVMRSVLAFAPDR